MRIWWFLRTHTVHGVPKTLSGEELDLDEAPARDSALFLVDGNNLAYRAFFALPEELATSDGQPTGALLGFANMLFKLLADYRPKGAAVAWDSRPVERAAAAEAGGVVYKEGRRPMPDLLREQFPHFRPIVEAFGYRNLEFEGWEADDVIATLATRAGAAGIKTCVVSTDRDAFQLVSENVTLMMTPRGVADVQVYTPERVEARYGIRPDQIPDFIGLKGDTSDNIPGVPGIGDKTAGALIAQYGTLEEVIAHAPDQTPARAKNILEHAGQASLSKQLATMRRDLDIDCDPAALVLSPPDRSQLKEMFRRFEFRNLLGRVDELDVALPAAVPMVSPETEVPWREGELVFSGEVGYAAVGDRAAVATAAGVVVGPRPSRVEGELVVHDAKSARVDAADDTLLAAYLIDPGRASYELDDLAAEYGVEVSPAPATDEETAALVRAAELPRRLVEPLLARLEERGLTRSVPRDRTAADPRARRHGARRGQDRHLPDGRDHRAARRARVGARGTGVRPGRRGVRPRLDAAGRTDPLREARPHRGPQGQDRLLDRRACPPVDPWRPRARPGDRGVARALEASQHLPRPTANTDRRGDRPPPHHYQSDGGVDRAALDDEPEPAGNPDPDAARARDPVGVHLPRRARSSCRPTTRRSSCGSSRTCRASRS